MTENIIIHDAPANHQETEETPLQYGDSAYSQVQDSHRDSLSTLGLKPPTEASWGSTGINLLHCYQQWTIHIGNSLAYLLGFSLAAMVGISRDQWLWHTLRTQFLPLKSIDAMFGATSNIFCFLDSNMILKAKVSTVMAAMKWLFPLATVFTPSTISVVPKYATSDFSCTVPSLDFNRDRRMLNKDYGNFLTSEGYLGYIGVTPRATKLLTVPALTGKVTTGGNPEFYESAWEKECNKNCTFTYTIQFDGPAVNCTETDPLKLPGFLPDFTSGLSQCEKIQTNNSEPTDIPVFFASRLSPTKFWVFHTIPKSPDSLIVCRNMKGYICQASTAQYNVTQVLSSHLLQEPVINSVNITSAVTEDYETYFSTKKGYDDGASWALFETVFDMLDGLFVLSVLSTDTEKDIPTYYTTTRVSETSLVGIKDYETVGSLDQAIQEISYKMTVSLLAYPLLVNAVNTTATCSATRQRNIYHYKPLILVVTYSVAIGVSSLMVALGFMALRRNGVASDASFSTILRTTRNRKLDEKFAGGCLGGSPLPAELGALRLKFGELSGYEVDHVGMGIEEEGEEEGGVLPIRRGARYI